MTAMKTKHPIRYDRILAIALAALLVAGFLWSERVRHRKTRAAEAEGKPVPVRVAAVERAEIPVIVEAVGTVRSRRQTEIAARVLADVQEIRHQPGDEVQAGDVLIVLESRDLKARFEQAAANQKARQEALGEAKTEFDRTKNLFAKQASTQQELDIARYRMAGAEAQEAAAGKALEEAQAMLGYATIKAPFKGMIFEKSADPGDLASPGKPLLGLYDPTQLRLDALIEERLLWTLKLKDSLEVYIDALGKTVTGQVSEIVPAVDPSTRTGTVKIDLPESAGIHPGMFGRARVPVAKRPAVVVPRAAVVLRGQLEMVFVVTGGPGAARARLRLVRTGDETGGPDARKVEILSGLDAKGAGEKVIVSGAEGLRDRDPVEEVRS
jgi:membrane fusion protein, multidrug efflux system